MQYAQLFTVSSAWVIDNVTSLTTALIVLCIGWYAAGFLSRRTASVLRRARRIDVTIVPLIIDLVRYFVLAITFVIVLAQFGVQTASILAILGAVGLAIALALQGTLSNIAAGIMLFWLRPFNVGDGIDADGISGSVTEVGLFGTKLRTYDGIFIFAPNSKLWNAKIINYSREKTRMVEVSFSIDYGSDIATARAVMLTLARDPRVLGTPEPNVFVAELRDSAVVMTLRVWAAASDWWGVKTAFTEQGKLALQAAGVELAFKRLDVKLLDAAPASPPTPGVPPR